MRKFPVFLLMISQVLCENCVTIPSYNLTVYRSVDGEPESTSSSARIQLDDDAFHLLLVNQSIARLCENSIEITNELAVLQILNCNLVEIDPGALRITPTLTLLKISSNLLTTIKTGVFNTVRVKEIDLSNNFISAIEDQAFNNITTLEILKLNYNALKQITPEWFKNTPNVYYFSAIYNEISKLSDNAFSSLTTSRPLKLGLSANTMTEIRGNPFRGVNIDTLKLNGNKLVTLPAEMFANGTLKVLQVNANRLVCFPDEFYKSNVGRLEFIENPGFNCTCLRKVKKFVEENNVNILYPAIICEDRDAEVQIVFNFNKTYEIPLLPPLG